jgi:hypothetical protein
MGWTAKETVLFLGRDKSVFLFSAMPKMAVGTIQPPIQMSKPFTGYSLAFTNYVMCCFFIFLKFPARVLI